MCDIEKFILLNTDIFNEYLFIFYAVAFTYYMLVVLVGSVLVVGPLLGNCLLVFLHVPVILIH